MHRRSRAGLKKTGLLALALMLALGALGVAYSAWTDSVYVSGTVNTGTLEMDIAGVSSTFVYKVPGAQVQGLPLDTVVHFPVYGDTDQEPLRNAILVASAVAKDTSTVKDDLDSATMIFSGLFPGVDFRADLELEYLGSVPGKISIAEIDPDRSDEILAELWELGETSGHTYGAWMDGEVSVGGTQSPSYVPDLLGLPLLKYDMVHVTLHVRLPEGQYEGLSSKAFAGLITVVQWNLYEE